MVTGGLRKSTYFDFPTFALVTAVARLAMRLAKRHAALQKESLKVSKREIFHAVQIEDDEERYLPYVSRKTLIRETRGF